MNILQILPELNIGGVETGTVDFARYLVQHGHTSVVVSNGGALVDDLENNGSRHYKLPVHKKNLGTMFCQVRKIRKIILEEKIDIVHARSRVPAWIAFLACRGTHASFITTCHGFYKGRPFSQIMVWSKLIIVPSDSIGRYMIDAYKVPPHHIRCIPRSVNLDRFPLTPPTPTGKNNRYFTVTIAGRLTPLKGHVYFLKAMAKVARQMPYLRIRIIGDAPSEKSYYRHELEVLTRQLGLTTIVEFMGNRQDIAELLASSDVVVMSTITEESFGRVLIEAQAVGTPVIATKIQGVVDIIDDEETGLLVYPRDVDGMAKAVLRLYHDRELGRRLVLKAQEKISRHFTLEHMASQTLAVYQELLDSMHILVIKVSALGDVVLVTPSLRAIRKHFPKAKIVCLVGKKARKILQGCPYIDELMVYDPQDKHRGWWGVLRLAKKLHTYHFDKVIDFQNNRKSHLLGYLTLANERYGYDNKKWGRLLSHGVNNPHVELAPVPHQFEVLKLLGIKPKDDFCELWPSAQDQKHVDALFEAEWLGNTRNIVGIHVAASARWSTKNWPLEHIAKLCDVLAAKNIRVCLTGVDADRYDVERLLKMTKAKPANFVGKTDILQLAALMKRCRVFVSPDSAPLHVAASVGTPFVALFGPTSSRRHLPPAKRYVVLESELSCTPCYSPNCKILTHACMHDITPDAVLRGIEQLMQGENT